MKNIIKYKFQLFVALSSIFVCTMIIVYGYRFIHYYKLEQAENEKLETTILNEKLKLSKEVLTDNNLYYFENNPKNNYIWYSGILWRIIDFNDEYVRVISNDTLTSLIYKHNTSWLENTFKPSLNKELLYDENITLLSNEDYQKYGEKSSYLNTHNYFWTSNQDDENIYFINVNGEIDSNLVNSETYYSYGIRPVIKLKSNVNFKTGDGSINKPFTLVDRNINSLSDVNIGEYILYSSYKWRIVSKETDKIKVVLDGVIEENNKKLEQTFSSNDNTFNVYEGIGYYLNNDFYNTLNNKEYIISSNWNINSYSYENDYNYQKINDSVNTNIGLLSIGEIFTSSYSNYHLLTTFNEYENTIYIQDEYSKIFADMISSSHNIRPALYLKNNLGIISGVGLENNPYIIG